MTPIQRPPPLPQPPPVLRKAIAYLVHFMTDVVEEDRHKAVAVVRVQVGPPAIHLIVYGLIDRLGASSAELQRCAAEALVGLGPVAISPAVGELARRRNPLVRARLVRVLADLGRSLGGDDRLELVDLFETVGAGDRSGILASACRTAIKALRCEWSWCRYWPPYEESVMAALSVLRPPEEPRDPQTRRALRHIAKLLVSPDESVRRHTLAVVVGTMNPAVRASVVAELIGVLHRGRADACRHATEALTAIGPLAVPALVYSLQQEGSAAWQLRLAGALALIAPTLAGEERARLQINLRCVLFSTPHDAVASAVVRVLASLEVAEARAARTAELV